MLTKPALLALTALLTSVKAAPTTPNNAKRTPSFLAADDSINDCGDSTFIQQVSDASPSIGDCQHIVSNIAGGGTWTVATDQQHQLVEWGTCAFGVTVNPDDDAWYAHIGNQDIMDLINESVNRFGSNGKVGTKGEMRCQGGITGGTRVGWGIYHTR